MGPRRSIADRHGGTRPRRAFGIVITLTRTALVTGKPGQPLVEKEITQYTTKGWLQVLVYKYSCATMLCMRDMSPISSGTGAEDAVRQTPADAECANAEVACYCVINSPGLQPESTSASTAGPCTVISSGADMTIDTDNSAYCFFFPLFILLPNLRNHLPPLFFSHFPLMK